MSLQIVPQLLDSYDTHTHIIYGFRFCFKLFDTSELLFDNNNNNNNLNINAQHMKFIFLAFPYLQEKFVL